MEGAALAAAGRRTGRREIGEKPKIYHQPSHRTRLTAQPRDCLPTH